MFYQDILKAQKDLFVVGGQDSGGDRDQESLAMGFRRNHLDVDREGPQLIKERDDQDPIRKDNQQLPVDLYETDHCDEVLIVFGNG